jgi:hypothetical protein
VTEVQYVIAFFFGLAAIGFAIYIVAWLVVAFAMWLLVPALLVILPITILAGICTSIVVMVLSLWGKPGFGARDVTPDDVVASPVLRQRRKAKRDHAWPVYTAAQWKPDQGAMLAAVRTVNASLWRGLVRRARDWDVTGYVIGALVSPVVAVFSLATVITWAVLAAVCGVVVTAGWLGWLVVSGALRGFDTAIRRLRRAKGSCPRCYHVTDLPLFPCDRCGRVHSDIRPGRLGGLWRRCACGSRLPTTVLRASGRLTPTCPRCDNELRPGAATVTDIRLPVFGPVSAGKTRLIYAGMLAVRDRAAGAGIGFDFVDEDSRAAFDQGVSVISSGSTTVKTEAGKLPPAITVRLTAGRRRALVHLFDAAGESYVDRDENSELEFLDHAQGLVFVVDPFSLGWVRDQLGGAGSATVSSANPATDDAEQTYHLTVRRLQDFRIDTGKRRLAVAVVKSDLLSGLPFAEFLLRGEVERWLVEAGLDNLVLSAQRDFAEVRFFVVASIAHKGDRALASPAEPFGWLLSKSGFAALPVEPERSEEVV